MHDTAIGVYENRQLHGSTNVGMSCGQIDRPNDSLYGPFRVNMIACLPMLAGYSSSIHWFPVPTLEVGLELLPIRIWQIQLAFKLQNFEKKYKKRVQYLVENLYRS